MTKELTNTKSPSSQNDKEVFVSTRHRDAPPDLYDPNTPRLGRRESEPHSSEITYLHDILETNFPNGRTIWDLHHYFIVDDIEIDIQFDISYFHDFSIPYTLSSYKASKYGGRKPTLAFNVLSKSTWRADIGENADYCRLLQIPVYIVFPSYHVASAIYKPPFLRAYILQSSGEYHIQEIKDVTIDKDGKINENAVINLSHILPIQLGIMERKKQHEGNLSLYRVILLKKDSFELYLTRVEQEKARADEEKARADEEKARADEEKARADKLEDEVKKLKDQLKQIKKSN
jgi:hypothetical protein